MIASICTRISKLPVCSGVAKLLYQSLHKSMCNPISISAADAREKLDSVYKEPASILTWNRNAPTKTVDLSIVVPFYKTEQYAERCIDSILGQKCNYSTEVILVDDGSPDRCGEILDSYAKNKNVIVIHQDNSGLSAARNTGLAEARGEYVMFVDSDDYLLPDAVQVLMDCARKYNADIVEGSHQTFTNRGVRKKYLHEFEIANGGVKMFGYAWGKVYRTQLFDSVCFPEGYWYEDTIMHAIIYPKVCTTVCIPDVVYGYFINQQGISMQTKSNIKCIDSLYIINLILDYYAKTGKELPAQLRRGLMGQLGILLFFRTEKLTCELQTAVFALAADMMERYNIQPPASANYYENEIYLALKNRQYKRWKWASILA